MSYLHQFRYLLGIALFIGLIIQSCRISGTHERYYLFIYYELALLFIIY